MEAIATLEDNGAPDNTIQKAKDNLSKYKESVGLPTQVLSAKAKESIVEPGSVKFMGSPLRPYPMQGGQKLLEVSPGPYTEKQAPTVDQNKETEPTQDVFQYKDETRIADLQAQLADAQANNGSQRSIDRLQKAIKVEQEKPTNVTLQATPDQYQTLLEERTQREKDQAMAQARSAPRYEQQNIPANTEELYNDTREQINAKVEEDNAKRDELVKQHDALAKQLAALEEKRTALDEQGDEANKNKDEHLSDMIRSNVLDSINESPIKSLLLYEIPSTMCGSTLSYLVKEIDKITIIEKTCRYIIDWNRMIEKSKIET
jgi:hypothetical protein